MSVDFLSHAQFENQGQFYWACRMIRLYAAAGDKPF